MTNAEAIKDIKENIKPIVGGKSLDMAIAALEKQEGKRPRTKRTNYDKYGQYCVDYYCPCCNRRIVSWDLTGWFGGKPVMYCECGQRIDWSDEHETN